MSDPQVQPATDGVPGRLSAGTPLRLPGAAVAAALADLEFGEVLGAVAGHASGPLGAARIRARAPSSDLDWIRYELRLAGEVAAIFRRGEKVTAEPVPDVSRALARLRIEGSVMELAELRDVRVLLGAARLVDAEVRRVAEQSPLLAALAVPLPDKAIDRRLELSIGDDGGCWTPPVPPSRPHVVRSRRRDSGWFAASRECCGALSRPRQ